MPKSKKTIKLETRTYKVKNPTKLRIGTRKNGRSALTMSNAELNEVLKSDDKRKWHSNAMTVLKARGVI